ncbi:MAG: hypothetical protein FWD62_05415 [Betaproteobacteria bacterium]|nr:hypothetical protein [Betaproteobacteria bacterium]
MDRKKVLLAGILAGMSAPGAVFSAAHYPTLQGSDLERMRRSTVRVGDDFRKVMASEHSETERKAP